MKDLIKKISKLTVECMINNFTFREVILNRNYCKLENDYDKIDCIYFNKKSERSMCEYE